MQMYTSSMCYTPTNGRYPKVRKYRNLTLLAVLKTLLRNQKKASNSLADREGGDQSFRLGQFPFELLYFLGRERHPFRADYVVWP